MFHSSMNLVNGQLHPPPPTCFLGSGKRRGEGEKNKPSLTPHSLQGLDFSVRLELSLQSLPPTKKIIALLWKRAWFKCDICLPLISQKQSVWHLNVFGSLKLTASKKGWKIPWEINKSGRAVVYSSSKIYGIYSDLFFVYANHPQTGSDV